MLSTVITVCLCCEWCSQFWFPSASQRRYGTGRVTRYRSASVWGTAKQTGSIQPWEETTGEQDMNKDLKKAMRRLTEMLLLLFLILKKYQVKIASRAVGCRTRPFHRAYKGSERCQCVGENLLFCKIQKDHLLLRNFCKIHVGEWRSVLIFQFFSSQLGAKE